MNGLDRLIYGLNFSAYQSCPRGAGDLADHRKKFLVHRVIDGRYCCMDVELSWRLPGD